MKINLDFEVVSLTHISETTSINGLTDILKRSSIDKVEPLPDKVEVKLRSGSDKLSVFVSSDEAKSIHVGDDVGVSFSFKNVDLPSLVREFTEQSKSLASPIVDIDHLVDMILDLKPCRLRDSLRRDLSQSLGNKSSD